MWFNVSEINDWKSECLQINELQSVLIAVNQSSQRAAYMLH